MYKFYFWYKFKGEDMYIYILHIKFSVNGEVMGESVQSIANNTKTRTHIFYYAYFMVFLYVE